MILTLIIERRKGKKIKAKGCYRDAVRSSKKDDHTTQAVDSLERFIVLVGDGAYAAVSLALCCAGFPVPVILISRLRLDASLYDPPPPEKPGKRGPKPKKGKKQRSLLERIADPSTKWTTIQIIWYDGVKRTLEIFSGVSLWYTPGFAPIEIRWVVVRDPKGQLRTEAFFSTNINVSAKQILHWFILRWNVETTFQELRAHPGVETQRQWSDLAIARTTPILFSLFSLVVLITNQLIKDGKVPVQDYAWYKKSEATFSDVIGLVRRHIWSSRYYANSSPQHDPGVMSTLKYRVEPG